MQIVHAKRGFLLALASFAGFLIYSGFHLKYYVRTGPGPGFFPIWIGALLACGTLGLLARSFMEQDDTEPFFPSREAATGVFAVLAALLATWFGLKYFGYRLTILAFCLFVPRVFGKQPLILTIATALFMSFAVGVIFERWLGVFLPDPSIEILKRLGL